VDYCSLFETFLRDVPSFAPSDEAAILLDAIAQPFRIARGGVVPLDGSADVLVYVAKGATKLIANASGGREQIVAFHFRGDLVSVPVDSWHSYALCGLSESEGLVFPAEEFLKRSDIDPSFHNVLLQRSLTALHRCRDKAVGLGRKSAEERLASFLVGLAERIGTRDGPPCTLDMPMSRRDIGDSLGLTIETISRQFSSLRNAGLIETEGRSRVILFDISQLSLRAGHI